MLVLLHCGSLLLKPEINTQGPSRLSLSGDVQKQYIRALKGPPNLKNPPEWHGADAYGLHVIIMGMHYKNKAVDECVKSKGFAEK